MTDSAIRSKLQRRARDVAPMLPGKWKHYVSVQAGGLCARIIFVEIAGPGRIVISESGSVASIEVNDKHLAARVSGTIRSGAKESA